MTRRGTRTPTRAVELWRIGVLIAPALVLGPAGRIVGGLAGRAWTFAGTLPTGRLPSMPRPPAW